MNYRAYLTSIRSASGWSQEKIASKLNVSFATVNSWINGRSEPRNKAKLKIEKLYLDIVGSYDVQPTELETLKKKATKKRLHVKTLLANKILLDTLTLHLTYHTNTIEGSTMTLSDVGDVLFDNKVLTNRTAIEQLEARNHQACLHWLLQKLYAEGDTFRIDTDLIREVNVRLMNGIIADAGKFRTHSVRIMGSHVTLSNWQKIPQALGQLQENLGTNNGNIVSAIAKSHAEFEKIHPFSDGNGRTGRLLMLAQALQKGVMPPLVLKERRYAYYKYLEDAQTKENYLPLEKFIAESIISTDSLLKEK